MMTPKTAAREAIQLALYGAKLLGLPWVDFGHRRAALILRYHSVSDAAQRNYLYLEPGIAVPPAIFERQIALLAHRYACVSMDELAEALDGGRPLPRNAVVVTFDDGYRDNYTYAYPILHRHRVPAIFYLATGSLDGGRPLWPSQLRYLVQMAAAARWPLSTLGVTVDLTSPPARMQALADLKARLVGLARRERDAVLDELCALWNVDCTPLQETMLTWRQVREMQRGGVLFGAHTVSHPRLPDVPLDEARDEIEGSRAALESQLGRQPEHFSYPNPGKGVHWNERIRRLVADAGFRTATTSDERYVDLGDDPLALRRIAVRGTRWGLVLDLERRALRPQEGRMHRERSPGPAGNSRSAGQGQRSPLTMKQTQKSSN